MSVAMVSAVIPLYNKVSHVQRAIDSVLAQTCGDWELIVVDDGSTDGSADVVRRNSDGRIRLVVQENGGVSAARNRGAAEAKCDLVAFLDADDQWQPDFLETVLKLRERFPQAAVWATAYAVIADNGESLCTEFPGTAGSDADGGLIDYFRSPGPWMPVHASAVMVRRDSLAKAGGFPVGVRCGEDWDTWIRLALRYPIAWSPQPKALLHFDAENRTEGDYCYMGVAPHFRSLRVFQAEAGRQPRLAEHVRRHIAWAHMRLLFGNWLAGERENMKTILDDCRGVKGMEMRCLLWRCLRCLPRSVVVGAWKLRQLLAGRPARLPAFRDIHRPKGN
jgi:glycosyltransferase involved in cell wall biosynthesis